MSKRKSGDAALDHDPGPPTRLSGTPVTPDMIRPLPPTLTTPPTPQPLTPTPKIVQDEGTPFKSSGNRARFDMAVRVLRDLFQAAETCNLYGEISTGVLFQNGEATVVRRTLGGTEK